MTLWSLSGAAFSSRSPRRRSDLVTAAGDHGIAVEIDHLQPPQIRPLVERVDSEQERLDVLVNDIRGGEHEEVPCPAR